MRAASKSRGVSKILVRPALWFCACNLLAAALAAQCTNPTPVPNGTYTSGDHSVTNNNALSASNFVISGSATATFVAGNCIQLLPGFRATAGIAGTTFHAWVETVPAAVSVSPSSGSGLSQPFTWTVSSPSGYSNLSDVYALFNTSISGANACYIHYNRSSNLIYVADSPGSNWSTGIPPGSSGTTGAFSPNCTINGTGSSVNPSGTQLALTVSVTFQTAFAGTKNEYLIAYDNQGLNTTWQQFGTWTVPAPQQYYLTTAVSPSGGGTISPPCPGGCLYTSGTVVQISANAASGYVFSGFSGNLGGTFTPQNLTMNGPKSVSANFTALPTITGISPTSGAIGSPVTITGTGFGTSGTVSFAGTPAPIISWSTTTVVAQVPNGATTGTISLSAGGYQAAYQQQQFQVTPVGVTVSPPSASLGQGQTKQFTATVTGTSNQQVTWSVAGAGSVSSTGVYTAPGTIAAQQTVTVTATSVAQTSATGSATVTLNPPPTINSQQVQPPGLSLTQGPPQMGFVISGANFGSVQGSVTLTGLPGGDKPLTVINNSWSPTSITVQVPAGTPLGAGQVYVKPPANVASNQVPFTVSQAFGCTF